MQNRIKELREKRGISQADIARGVHLTRSAVGYYETGKRGASNNQTWQKPIPVLKRLINLFTDSGDVVIDPTAGSGSTLRAAAELKRNAYGFEVEREMCEKAKKNMLQRTELSLL
jgi:DNA modification methylase